MLEIGQEFSYCLYYICLGEVILSKDGFELLKEAIDLTHLMTGGLLDDAKSLEALHVYLLARDVELLVGFFTSSIRREISYRIFHE